MVVWHHALGQVPGMTDFIRLPEFGPYGVDVFFAISGFIMVVTTQRPITGLRFIGLRIVRVVPLYWMATLAMVGLAHAFPGAFKTLRFDAASVVKSLLFIPYDSLAAPGNVWPVLIPGWTLNFEMFFYALFALALYLPCWRQPVLLGVLAALVAVGAVWHGSPAAWVYTNPRLLEFGIGMCLAWGWIRGGARGRCFDSVVLCELGNASYSIYLTHLFTLGALRIAWVRLVPAVSLPSTLAFMGVALSVASLAGWLCYRLIERPLTTRLQATLRRSGDSRPSASLSAALSPLRRA